MQEHNLNAAPHTTGNDLGICRACVEIVEMPGHNLNAEPHATGDDNPDGDVCRGCVEDPDNHRFTLLVAEKYPDGRERRIGRIEEDDDAQEYTALGTLIPSLGSKSEKVIGGFPRLQLARDAVLRYWLTEPAPADEWFYIRVISRAIRIKVLDESHPTSNDYSWTPVDVRDVEGRMETQAIVRSGLSIPVLLAQHQVQAAISSVILNATTKWTQDPDSGAWSGIGTGRHLTDEEKRGIHP